MKIIVTKLQAATFFGKRRRDIERWCKKGCPGRIGPDQYNLQQLYNWRMSQGVFERGKPIPEAMKPLIQEKA